MRLKLALFLTLFSTLIYADSKTASLNLEWIDKKIDPTQNFYAYANGNWQKHNPIPAAYPSWNIFYALHENNQLLIKKIVEAAVQKTSSSQTTIEQKIGDFYASGMDEKNINALGVAPLRTEFDRINGIKNLADLQKVTTHLQMIGVGAFFNLGQMQDFKDSKSVIGLLMQGGMGLPDRDYYLKSDQKSEQLRQIYRQHIKNLFFLLGYSTQNAEHAATVIMQIETQLAKASLSQVELRIPQITYHPMVINNLQKLTPNFNWSSYLNGMNHPEIHSLNVSAPYFFQTVNSIIGQTPLEDLKTYLRGQLIETFAPCLSEPFVKESFSMTARLTGAKELLPRWKRVLSQENEALGFAIGKQYVDKYFTASSKEAITKLIKNIRQELKIKLLHADWMSVTTRNAALKKLELMQERVGYPNKWRDYSSLTIDRGPYVLNIMRTNIFLNQYELNKIGKPVDLEEWEMTPQTINAYYNPSRNTLNIPAGILQPPFFDPDAPSAVNYGAIGFVIGHEITHGFDDQGAQFDGHGNLKNWWSKEDLQKFHQQSQQIVQRFSSYTINGNVHLQGNLVVGEATADAGGLDLAYRAFCSSIDYKKAETIAGFSPDQQFFLGAGHVWAANIRPEEAERLVMVDPHPPALYRVNGTVLSMKAFNAVFPKATSAFSHHA